MDLARLYRSTIQSSHHAMTPPAPRSVPTRAQIWHPSQRRAACNQPRLPRWGVRITKPRRRVPTHRQHHLPQCLLFLSAAHRFRDLVIYREVGPDNKGHALCLRDCVARWAGWRITVHDFAGSGTAAALAGSMQLTFGRLDRAMRSAFPGGRRVAPCPALTGPTDPGRVP
jgi:hypothetical protein